MVLKIKKNDGQEVQMTIKAKNEKVKTVRNGQTYQLGALVRLADEGKLSDKELLENAALVNISQAEAIEMVEEAVRLKSVHLDISEVVVA